MKNIRNNKLIIAFLLVLVSPLYSYSSTESVDFVVTTQKSWVAIAGLALSAISMGIGAIQNRKARKLEEANMRPVMERDPNLALNQELARRMSQEGLPEQVYQNALNNINRNQAGAIRLGLTSGRGANVANILRQTNDATLQLEAQDAEAQYRNMTTYMNANQAMADENANMFDWNQRQRYLAIQQQVQAYRNAGTSSIYGGIAGFGQLATSGALNNLGKEVKGIFPRSTQPPTPTSAQNTGLTSNVTSTNG